MTEILQRSRRRFTCSEVLRMLEVGILDEDEPFELIEGELVAMTPQGNTHVRLIVIIHEQLSTAYGPKFHIQDHSPFEASDDTMPEPDIAVIRGGSRDFPERMPTGLDTVLAVEVAVTTRAEARAKSPIYAKAGVANYWIVDTERRQLTVCSQPNHKGTWGHTAVLGAEERVQAPESMTSFLVAELLP